MANYNDCIIFLLAKAYQKGHAAFKKRLQPHGLTPIQHLILEILWVEEGVSAGDIGKRLVLDAATLSGVLDRLADSGWIVKQTDPDDKRVVRIYLSDKARTLGPDLEKERELVNEEILGNLTLEEKVLLKRLLKDIT